MLGRQIADENTTVGTVCETRSEDLFGKQDSEAVMQQHPVPVVGQVSLRGVEPLMQWQIVVSGSAPLAGRALSMDEGIAQEKDSSSAV